MERHLDFGTRHTESELAIRLDRDIAALAQQGVPIEGEAGVGYRMRAGFDLPPGQHPITPVMFPGDEGARQAGTIAEAMLRRGVYVVAFSFPVVPHGRARIRVQLSAAHTEEDVRECVDAFVRARQAVVG